jgi:hypothetical protein
VRYALIAVKMKDRKPEDILHTEEGFFKFDFCRNTGDNIIPGDSSQIEVF